MATQYRPAAGETFDSVARKLYGEEKYSYILLAANPALCHKLTFSGGETLTVPETDEEARETLAPWKA